MSPCFVLFFSFFVLLFWAIIPPFNSVPFIWEQFFFFFREVTSLQREKKAIKTDGFLIIGKPQRHELFSETILIIQQTQLSPSLPREPSSVGVVWHLKSRFVFCFFVSPTFMNLFKVGHGERDKSKQKYFKMWSGLVWSMIGLSRVFTRVRLSEIQSCGCFVFATLLLWKQKKKKKNHVRETCVISAGRRAASSLSVVFVPRPICSVDST